ncbi:DUF192 domain-containing protein [Paraburkholderia bryophila]|uniref:DUF192 domain-containing protein n=1 Tax=Paraburkholderia bryophila TaxID=420952 RepID=UPI0038B91AA3
MRTAHLYLDGRDVGVAVEVTETARERLRGLLGRDHLSADEALLLKRCGSVHTFGMRFAIDVVFLNRRQRIVAIYHGVPRRRVVLDFRAAQTLEMSAGAARRLRLAVGDCLAFEAVS